MPILGVGVDILETQRVVRALETLGEPFAAEWLSPRELAVWRRSPRRAAALASAVTAKEACFKCLGFGLGSGIPWGDVELDLRGSDRPSIELRGGALAMANRRGVERVHVSLASTERYAAAAVLLEGTPHATPEEETGT